MQPGGEPPAYSAGQTSADRGPRSHAVKLAQSKAAPLQGVQALRPAAKADLNIGARSPFLLMTIFSRPSHFAIP